MRRAIAIIKSTALELLSEPLVFLVLISAMSLSVLAPAMHYHAFGDATRMARDAGISALLLGGAVIVLFGAVKTFRREIEMQTAMSVLALPVSRRRFFLSKVLGVLAVYSVFFVSVSAVSLAVVRGAGIGLEIAARQGMLPRLYGPVFALAVSACVIPFLYGAAVNRLKGKRFVLHANLCAVVLAIAAVIPCLDRSVFAALSPLYVLAALPSTVLLTAAASFAARYPMNLATTLALTVFGLFLPALGNYCLTDVLSAGESISWIYVLRAGAAILPIAAALVLLGVKLFEDAE